MTARHEPAVEELLRRAGAGDPDAAGQVVMAYDERLRRVVVRLRLDVRVARRVDVDDVLQETHIEALQRLPEFLAQREVSLLIWLRFLAVQRCLTLARRHLAAAARDVRRERQFTEQESDATSMALEHALAASLTTPSRGAARNETRAGLRTAIQALEPLDREILCLRHFEELDNGESAAVLGIANAAASKRYIRALARLRTVLAAAGLDSSSTGL